jgi:hypothetical protein
VVAFDVEGIVVRATKRRVRVRGDSGRYSVVALRDTAPVLGFPPVETKRIVCSVCASTFLVPASAGTLAAAGHSGRRRWICTTAAPFHLQRPARLHACAGSESFAISEEDWRPRSGRFSPSLRLVFPDDPTVGRARMRFERG